MAITITRDGYGQVEPNQLSAQKTGQIYASLPADAQLENGEFAYYNAATGKVTKTAVYGEELMLVFNEVKLYENRLHTKDFALGAGECPRLFKTNIGDIMTTNMVKEGSYTVGAILVPGPVEGKNGLVLQVTTGVPDGVYPGWVVVKETTMPDGQPAVKVQRVADQTVQGE